MVRRLRSEQAQPCEHVAQLYLQRTLGFGSAKPGYVTLLISACNRWSEIPLSSEPSARRSRP